jgi:hypothetical protein
MSGRGGGSPCSHIRIRFTVIYCILPDIFLWEIIITIIVVYYSAADLIYRAKWCFLL